MSSRRSESGRVGALSRWGFVSGAGIHGRRAKLSKVGGDRVRFVVLRVWLLWGVLLGILAPVQAATVSLLWNASPDASVRGYRIYYSLQGQPLINWVNAGLSTTGSVTGLANNATYRFAVCAYNDAGLESSLSSEVTASIGAAPALPNPGVVLVSTTTATSAMIAPAALDFRADVTANGHVITRVDFLSGEVLLSSDSTAPYTFSWSGIAAGNYSVMARVYYDGASHLDSAVLAFSVAPPAGVGDPNAPAVSLTSPTDGSLRIAGLSIGLSASVTPNGHTISKVQFLDGTRLLGEDSSAPYSLIWSTVPAGNYAINARVIYDGSFSVGSAVSSVTVEEPPTVSIIAPAPGAPLGAPATAAITAAAVANGHTLVKVRFYSAGVLLGEDLTAPFSFSWPGLGVGIYSVTAVLYYDSNRTVSSAPATFSVIALPPAITLMAPLEESTVSLPAEIPMSASVTPNGHALSKVQFLVDGTVAGESIGPDYSSSWSPSNPGFYSIAARLFFDGGSTIDSAPVSVRVVYPPPSVSLLTPIAGSFLSVGATTRLEATVQSHGDVVEGVDFLVDGAVIGVAAAVPYVVDWTPRETGARSLEVRVRYGGGRESMSKAVQVTIGDLPAPWLSVDIAPSALPGTSSALENGFRIAGSGVVYGTSDSFRFVYQTMEGDGEIRARVVTTSETGRSGGVGVMIRESTAPGSRHAFMAVVPTQEWRWERRGETGGSTWTSNYGTLTLPSAWVRLVRTGEVISGYTSIDGANWTLQNSRNIAMGTIVLAGLAVSSGTSGVQNTTEFSEVIVRP